ncbi:MAG: hypothetical protein U0T36_06260 [Saprospiraceae bacterium]
MVHLEVVAIKDIVVLAICNKHNTYDWIAARDIYDPSAYNIVEVSFKKGSHKDFFINDPGTRSMTGDMVVVETASGYDVGRISLSGDW